MRFALDPEIFVTHLFRIILGREPDADGLRHWSEVVNTNSDPTFVVAQLLASEEYRSKQTSDSEDETQIAKRSIERFGNRIFKIVDVGAQALSFETHIYAPVIAAGIDYHIVGFEPLQHRLDERVQAEHDSKQSILPYAIGDGGTYDLRVNNIDATSSLYDLNADLCPLFSDLRTLRTVGQISVETKRLDDLLPPDPIDYLKIDVQGAELMVLHGAENILKHTYCVHSEVEFSQVYAGQPLFGDISAFLTSQGFYLVDLVRQERCGYVNADNIRRGRRLMWAEAIFFRNTDDQQALESQALAAAIIYDKPNLADHLLASARVRALLR